MNDQLGFADLERIDPALSALIAAEEKRQREKIILIPSESLTPPAVREALRVHERLRRGISPRRDADAPAGASRRY